MLWGTQMGKEVDTLHRSPQSNKRTSWCWMLTWGKIMPAKVCVKIPVTKHKKPGKWLVGQGHM